MQPLARATDLHHWPNGSIPGLDQEVNPILSIYPSRTPCYEGMHYLDSPWPAVPTDCELVLY